MSGESPSETHPDCLSFHSSRILRLSLFFREVDSDEMGQERLLVPSAHPNSIWESLGWSQNPNHTLKQVIPKIVWSLLTLCKHFKKSTLTLQIKTINAYSSTYHPASEINSQFSSSDFGFFVLKTHPCFSRKKGSENQNKMKQQNKI